MDIFIGLTFILSVVSFNIAALAGLIYMWKEWVEYPTFGVFIGAMLSTSGFLFLISFTAMILT